MTDEQRRIQRLENALAALLAELYGRQDTHADILRLSQRDADVGALMRGES